MDRKLSSGLSPVVVVILLAVIAVALLFFFKIGTFPIVRTPLTGTSKRISEKDYFFVRDLNMRKHFTAMRNQRFFRIKSFNQDELEEGITSASYFEVDVSRGIINSYVWYEENGDRDFEMKIVDGTVYVKDYEDNLWWREELPVDEKKELADTSQLVLPSLVGEGDSEALANIEYENMGEELCPGQSSLTCYKYKEVDSQAPEAPRIFWFDVDDYLLRREEEGYAEFRSVSDYTYDGIEITSPSDTKDVPEGQEIEYYLVGRGGVPIIPEDFDESELLDDPEREYGGEVGF